MIRKLTGVAVIGLFSVLLSTPAVAQKTPDEKDWTDPSGPGGCPAGDQCCECKKACREKRESAGAMCDWTKFINGIGRAICIQVADQAKKTCDTACNDKGGCNDTKLP